MHNLCNQFEAAKVYKPLLVSIDKLATYVAMYVLYIE